MFMCELDWLRFPNEFCWSFLHEQTHKPLCLWDLSEKERRQQGRQFEFSSSVLNIDSKECYLAILKGQGYILELDQKNPLTTWIWDMDILGIF